MFDNDTETRSYTEQDLETFEEMLERERARVAEEIAEYYGCRDA